MKNQLLINLNSLLDFELKLSLHSKKPAIAGFFNLNKTDLCLKFHSLVDTV